ncbi:MAG TPA: type VI secretion system baseplate subunit TssF [Stellaceae bacterium]|nr:type VI secretion system baseplate subunit TssF [Stellaceae bacterium]
MAIVQFVASNDLAARVTIPAGSALDTEPVRGESCRYRTGYDVELWPLAIEAATLAGRPIEAPPNPNAAGAAGVLRIRLRCTADGMALSAIAPDRLRFFINPRSQHAHRLYELVLNHTIALALADSPRDPSPVICAADDVQPVGFGEREWLLPYPSRSFVGYRLLTEYFAFSDKFLFFDVVGLQAKTLLSQQGSIELFFYLNRSHIELERTVSADSFALGCTPIVNLFPLRAEPIALDQSTAEYRLVPDVRRPTATEIYAIQSVTATAPDGRAQHYQPFFALHRAAEAAAGGYWHAARREAAIGGTDVFLSFVDLDFDITVAADHTVSIETLCLNRDLPSELPFGGGNPRLHLDEGSSAVAGITCLTPLSATLRPPLGGSTRWRLISHLMLNHLSITGGDEGADALRAILSLYDFRAAAQVKSLIASVLRVDSRPGVARIASAGMTGFCRGLDIEVDFAPDAFEGGQGFLFASILDRFFGLYTSLNSFTRMTARVRGRADPVRTWPARAGYRTLL